MKPSRSLLQSVRFSSIRWLAGLTGACLLLSGAALASGVVTACTEAELRAALAGGGTVVLACDGTIVLSSTLTIGTDTVLDASGRQVTLSGGGAVRVSVIQPGVSLTLRHLTLRDGFARGADGGVTSPFDPPPVGLIGEGAAVFNNGGTLRAEDCVFVGNRVRGGDGGAGVSGGGGLPSIPPGNGGVGRGGAVATTNGQVLATNCVFAGNTAEGGTGGPGMNSQLVTGGGGLARGGAIHSSSGFVAIAGCVFVSNRAKGGEGGSTTGLSAVSAGGDGTGGALSAVGGAVQISDSLVATNSAVPGSGRRYNTTAAASGTALGGAILSQEGGMTLKGTRLIGNSCGAIYLVPARGGALYQQGGTVAMTECLLAANLVLGGVGLGISSPQGIAGGPGLGGALYVAAGLCSITNSAFSANLASGGRAPSPSNSPGAGQGGAIHNSGTVEMLNCTLAGNTAQGGPAYASGIGGHGQGGGLFNNGGTLSLAHLTIVSNAAARSEPDSTFIKGLSQGGAIYSTTGSAAIRDSILARSTSGSNCFGAFADGGHNISSDGSCNLAAPGSLNNTDPVVGPLADYGGPTPTMALLAGSPALDAAASALCPPVDQRGRARPFGVGCDIGAFESSPPYTILGQVRGFTTPASGIQVAVPSASISLPPDGRIAFHGLAAGTHLLSLSSPDCVFAPRTRSVTVGPDVVDANFHSYRTNALFIERLSAGTVRCVYAGESGVTYRVLSGTDLLALTPSSTNQAQAEGLVEFTDSTVGKAARFFQVVRP